jgi:hypothetical protein
MISMPRFTVHSVDGDIAIQATSADGEGVHAESDSNVVAAVAAIQTNASLNATGAAVYGEARGGGAAVAAFQNNTDPNCIGAGVYAETKGGGAAVAAFIRDDASKAVAIYAENQGVSKDSHAIRAYQANPLSDAAAIHAEHATGKTAGYFRGNIIVTGDISFPGADCAEEFAAVEAVEAIPGTVMSLTDSGRIAPCAQPYERRVVGVVTGAGPLRPGIVMGRQANRTDARFPIALMGTVYCQVDTTNGPIDVGDLLTTSSTPGHAMKATDPMRAFGAVIGKAMGPLASGSGLVPVIVALQ